MSEMDFSNVFGPKPLNEMLEKHGLPGEVTLTDTHYVLTIDGHEEYATQKWEHMASHIQIMAVAKRFGL